MLRWVVFSVICSFKNKQIWDWEPKWASANSEQRWRFYISESKYETVAETDKLKKEGKRKKEKGWWVCSGWRRVLPFLIDRAPHRQSVSGDGTTWQNNPNPLYPMIISLSSLHSFNTRTCGSDWIRVFSSIHKVLQNESRGFNFLQVHYDLKSYQFMVFFFS